MNNIMNLKLWPVQPLAMVRGSTNQFLVAVQRNDGTAYTPSSSDALHFGIKRDPDDETYILKKTVTAHTGNIYKVELTVSDTKDWRPGQYYYDVAFDNSSGRTTIIPWSGFEIIPNVTAYGNDQEGPDEDWVSLKNHVLTISRANRASQSNSILAIE